MRRLAEYTHIVFTSVNAVDIFFHVLFSSRADARMLSAARVVAIGPATASRLRDNGIVADLIPAAYTSKGIVKELAEEDLVNATVLLPRALEASNSIVRFIRAKGGSCNLVPIYRTHVPLDPSPFDSKPDIITFTSSSTVKNFLALYGKETLDGVPIASIGPVTTKTLKSCGLSAHVEASQSDIPGLVRAMEEYVVGGGLS